MSDYEITVDWNPQHDPPKISFDPGPRVEVAPGTHTITFSKPPHAGTGTIKGIQIYSAVAKGPQNLVFDSTDPNGPSGSPFSAQLSNGDKKLTVTDANNAQSDTTYWYSITLNTANMGEQSNDPKIINKAPTGTG